MPGADHVGADAVRAALDDQLEGQRDHAALGGRVRVLRHELHAPQRGDRADVDDRAAAVRLQVRPGGAHRVVDEVELVAHREVPVLDGELVERAEALGRGVVVEHVDAVVRRDRGVHPAARGVRVTEVDPAHDGDLAALAADQLPRCAAAPPRRGRSPTTRAPSAANRPAAAAPMPPPTPGDQRDLAVEPAGHEPVTTASSGRAARSGCPRGRRRRPSGPRARATGGRHPVAGAGGEQARRRSPSRSSTSSARWPKPRVSAASTGLPACDARDVADAVQQLDPVARPG